MRLVALSSQLASIKTVLGPFPVGVGAFPTEIIDLIGGFVPWRDVNAMSRTCRRMTHLCANEHFIEVHRDDDGDCVEVKIPCWPNGIMHGWVRVRGPFDVMRIRYDFGKPSIWHSELDDGMEENFGHVSTSARASVCHESHSVSAWVDVIEDGKDIDLAGMKLLNSGIDLEKWEIEHGKITPESAVDWVNGLCTRATGSGGAIMPRELWQHPTYTPIYAWDELWPMIEKHTGLACML